MVSANYSFKCGGGSNAAQIKTCVCVPGAEPLLEDAQHISSLLERSEDRSIFRFVGGTWVSKLVLPNSRQCHLGFLGIFLKECSRMSVR